MCADIAGECERYEEIVFSDPGLARGTRVDEWTVAFHDQDLARTNEAYRFILGVGQIGNGAVRQRIFETIREMGLVPEAVVSTDSYVAAGVLVGGGTVVGRRAVVNPGAAIGENTIIKSMALVEHDARVGSHVHLSTGSIVNGDCVVGDRCLIGSGAVVLHGRVLCADAIVGAGAVVTRDIDEPGVYAGVPAMKMHDLKLG